MLQQSYEEIKVIYYDNCSLDIFSKMCCKVRSDSDVLIIERKYYFFCWFLKLLYDMYKEIK